MLSLQTPRGSTVQVSRVQAERALRTQGVNSSPIQSRSPPTQTGRATQNVRSSPTNGRTMSTTLGSPSNSRFNSTNSGNQRANVTSSPVRGRAVSSFDTTALRSAIDEDIEDEYAPEPRATNGRGDKLFATRTTSKVQQNLNTPKDVQQALQEMKKNTTVATKGVEVWPMNEIKPDHSKVDSIQELLRTKMETLAGFSSDPAIVVRKVFKDATRDGTSLTEDAFVRLVTMKFNFQGYENEIKALFKRFDMDRSGQIDVKEFLDIILVKGSANFSTVVGRIREALVKRSGGTSSLKGLALQFKIMDSSHDQSVDRQELEWGLKKFLRAFNVDLSDRELDALFTGFDENSDGSISYDEFIHGIRGGMNNFRTALVKQAFDILDEDKSGTLTVQEIASRYDVSGHPLVKAGKQTPVEAIKNFMLQWQLHSKDKDDLITLEEFIDYYDWISMNIDRDDYFELMIRNAWHIAGGKGWSENTSNLRVLVTHTDGHQSVEVINDDLGLKATDTEGIKKRLLKQGIRAKSISVKDASEI